MRKLLLALLLSLPSNGAITYFGYASNPADNGSLNGQTVTITPPSNMQAGDLAIVVLQVRLTGIALGEALVNTTGGQTWHMLTYDAGATNLSFRVFACRFNGTWGANPAFDMTAASPLTGKMDVFRPTSSSYAFDIDWSPNTGTYTSTGTTKTITGITTQTDGAFVYACWMSPAARTWSNLTSGWSYSGAANQVRNLQGSDQTMSCAYKIMATKGASGNVSNDQDVATAGATVIMAFNEHTAYLSSVPTVNVYMDFENSTDGTTATTTILAAGTHPASPGGTWSTSGAASTTTVETDAEKAMGRSATVSGDTTYTDSGNTRGIRYNHNSGTDTDSFSFTYSSTKTALSYGFYYKTTYPYGTFNYYTSMASFTSGGTYFTGLSMVAQYAAAHYTQLEANSTLRLGPNIVNSTQYWVTIKYDAANGIVKMAFFLPDSSWAQHGFSVVTSHNTGNLSFFQIFCTGGGYAAVNGLTDYDDVMLDWTNAVWPLGPGTPAAGGRRRVQMISQ